MAQLPELPALPTPEEWEKSILRTRTKLNPAQEIAFQAWYNGKSKEAGINTNPDDPLHKYDYRGAFKAGASPDPAQANHWPSRYKDDDHPNRWVNGVDTKAEDAAGAIDGLPELPPLPAPDPEYLKKQFGREILQRSFTPRFMGMRPEKLLSGLANAVSLGATKKITEGMFPKPSVLPQTGEDDLSEAAGHFLGFIGGPAMFAGKLAKEGTTLAARGVMNLFGKKAGAKFLEGATKVLGSKIGAMSLGQLAGRSIGQGIELGTASTVGGILGEGGTQKMGDKFLSNFLVGTVFPVAGLISGEKHKFIYGALRQIGGRAMMSGLGVYNASASLDAMTRGEGFADAMFSEILNTAFLAKGHPMAPKPEAPGAPPPPTSPSGRPVDAKGAAEYDAAMQDAAMKSARGPGDVGPNFTELPRQRVSPAVTGSPADSKALVNQRLVEAARGQRKAARAEELVAAARAKYEATVAAAPKDSATYFAHVAKVLGEVADLTARLKAIGGKLGIGSAGVGPNTIIKALGQDSPAAAVLMSTTPDKWEATMGQAAKDMAVVEAKAEQTSILIPDEVIPAANPARDMAILENVTGLKRGKGETYEQLQARAAKAMTPPAAPQPELPALPMPEQGQPLPTASAAPKKAQAMLDKNGRIIKTGRPELTSAIRMRETGEIITGLNHGLAMLELPLGEKTPLELIESGFIDSRGEFLSSKDREAGYINAEAARVAHKIAAKTAPSPQAAGKTYIYKSPYRPMWVGFGQTIGQEYEAIDASTFSTKKPLSRELIQKLELEPQDPHDPINMEKRFEAFKKDIIKKISGGATEFTLKDGRKLIFSDNLEPSERDKYPYRITNITSDGTPTGHIPYKDFREVALGLFGHEKEIVSATQAAKVTTEVPQNTPKFAQGASERGDLFADRPNDVPAPMTPAETGLPAWARESMEASGLKPGRVLNDADMLNPDLAELVKKDPVLAKIAEKDPELAQRAARGNVTPEELKPYLTATPASKPKPAKKTLLSTPEWADKDIAEALDLARLSHSSGGDVPIEFPELSRLTAKQVQDLEDRGFQVESEGEVVSRSSGRTTPSTVPKISVSNEAKSRIKAGKTDVPDGQPTSLRDRVKAKMARPEEPDPAQGHSRAWADKQYEKLKSELTRADTNLSDAAFPGLSPEQRRVEMSVLRRARELAHRRYEIFYKTYLDPTSEDYIPLRGREKPPQAGPAPTGPTENRPAWEGTKGVPEGSRRKPQGPIQSAVYGPQEGMGVVRQEPTEGVVPVEGGTPLVDREVGPVTRPAPREIPPAADRSEQMRLGEREQVPGEKTAAEKAAEGGGELPWKADAERYGATAAEKTDAYLKEQQKPLPQREVGTEGVKKGSQFDTAEPLDKRVRVMLPQNFYARANGKGLLKDSPVEIGKGRGRGVAVEMSIADVQRLAEEALYFGTKKAGNPSLSASARRTLDAITESGVLEGRQKRVGPPTEAEKDQRFIEIEGRKAAFAGKRRENLLPIEGREDWVLLRSLSGGKGLRPGREFIGYTKRGKAKYIWKGMGEFEASIPRALWNLEGGVDIESVANEFGSIKRNLSPQEASAEVYYGGSEKYGGTSSWGEEELYDYLKDVNRRIGNRNSGGTASKSGVRLTDEMLSESDRVEALKGQLESELTPEDKATADIIESTGRTKEEHGKVWDDQASSDMMTDLTKDYVAGKITKAQAIKQANEAIDMAQIEARKPTGEAPAKTTIEGVYEKIDKNVRLSDGEVVTLKENGIHYDEAEAPGGDAHYEIEFNEKTGKASIRYMGGKEVPPDTVPVDAWKEDAEPPADAATDPDPGKRLEYEYDANDGSIKKFVKDDPSKMPDHLNFITSRKDIKEAFHALGKFLEKHYEWPDEGVPAGPAQDRRERNRRAPTTNFYEEVPTGGKKVVSLGDNKDGRSLDEVHAKWLITSFKKHGDMTSRGAGLKEDLKALARTTTPTRYVVQMFPWMKGLMFESNRASINHYSAEKEGEVFLKDMDTLMGGKGSAKKGWRKIATFGVGSQPGGDKILERMKVKPIAPGSLTPGEKKVWEKAQEKVEEIARADNASRVLNGQEPVDMEKLKGRYWTLIHNTVYMTNTGGFNPTMDGAGAFERIMDPGSPYEKARVKSNVPVSLDGRETLRRYMLSMDRVTNMRHVTSLAKLYQKGIPNGVDKDGNEVLWKMSEEAPAAHRYVTGLVNYFSGLKGSLGSEGLDAISDIVGRAANMGSRAIAPLNFRMALTQLASLTNTIGKFGVNNTVASIMDWMSPATRKALRADSGQLAARRQIGDYGESLFGDSQNIIEGVKTKVSEGIKKATNVGTIPMRELDRYVAEWSYGAAKRYGKNTLRLEGDALQRYADDMVSATQGGLSRFDTPPIYRTGLGRGLFFMQRFTMNNINFFVRDVMGYKNPNMTRAEKTTNMFRYFAATAVINAIFEDVLKLRSPQSAPIREIVRSVKAGKSVGATAWGVGKEMMDMVPGVGYLRWATETRTPAPYPIQLASDIWKATTHLVEGGFNLSSLKGYDADAFAKLLGIPMSSQFMKMWRRYKEGASPYEVFVGSNREAPGYSAKKNKGYNF